MKKRSGEMTVAEYKKLELKLETHDHFMNQIVKAAESLGYDKIYHTWRSYHSPKGYLDLTLGRSRDGRLLYIEVKKEGDKLTPDQQKWFEFLTFVASLNKTIGVYVLYPHDWERIPSILQGGDIG